MVQETGRSHEKPAHNECYVCNNATNRRYRHVTDRHRWAYDEVDKDDRGGNIHLCFMLYVYVKHVLMSLIVSELS